MKEDAAGVLSSGEMCAGRQALKTRRILECFTMAEDEQIMEMIKENEKRMTALKAETDELKLKYIFLKHGVRIGSIVKDRYHKNLYKICSFRLDNGIKSLPHARGDIVKKDGTTGDVAVDLWYYEVITP
jgi:retron-type reverse transcriptase